MKQHIRVAVAATAVAAILGGIAATGPADAEPAHTTSAAPAEAPVQTRGPVVEHEQGIVLEGTGTAGDLSVSVTVYENSLHGNSVQVVVGDDLIGYAESDSAYLVDGTLHAAVTIDGKEAVLSGTLLPSGRPERLVEPVQDAGEQVVTRGTHTALAGDVSLTYDGTVVPLELVPAFRYDLEVRRVALYGG